MSYCPECGAESAGTQDFCGDCGVDLETGVMPADDGEDFIERYGAKPLLPFAELRYGIQYNYARLISKIPVVRSTVSFFVKLSFVTLGITASLLSAVTLGSQLSKRYNAEIEYAKDNYRAGMTGLERPPSPP
jgi:hypothetical protein